MAIALALGLVRMLGLALVLVLALDLALVPETTLPAVLRVMVKRECYISGCVK